MANKVLLKKSSVAAKIPLTTDLDYGELALNYADGKLYFKNSSNAIQSFTNDSSTVTLTGTQTLTNKTLSSPTLNGTTTLSGSEVLITAGSGGNEGGEIHFQTPPTGSSLVGPIAIDIYQNKIRFFETGGTNRGVFIDLTATSSGVATNLLSVSNASGTVTSITAGTGLTGGTITNTGTIAIDTSVVTTISGIQTLTNKTLTSPTINSATANNLTVTGTITAGGGVGTSGQVLQSTSTGVQWTSLSTVATSGSYTDLLNKPTIPTVPTAVSAFTNDANYATTSSVNTSISTAINNLINSAPGTLDTLGEIAAQLAADESAVAALTTTVAGKVSLTGSYANPSWITSLAYSKITGAPTAVSAFTNDAGYLTSTNPTLNNPTLTGTLTAGGGTGTAGQVLQSTGTGVQWATPAASESADVMYFNILSRVGEVQAKLTSLLQNFLNFDNQTFRTPVGFVDTRTATINVTG